MPDTQHSGVEASKNQQLINDLVNAIPKYNGNPKSLTRFINQTDEIIELINELSPTEIQKKLVLFQIKTKLIDRAEELISDNTFNSWKELREFLIIKYDDKQQPPSIVCNMVKLQQGRLTIFEYLKEIQNHYNRAVAKTNLCKLQPLSKEGIIVFIQSMAVHSFISNCKDPYRNNLATRNPSTLEEIESLLTNDFQYLDEKQHQNQNFAKPKVPFKPISHNPSSFVPQNPHFMQNRYRSPMQKFNVPQRTQQVHQPKPFAPRENVRNAQFQNHTPMSTQTKFSRPQNFFQQTRPQQNFITEELYNQNFETDAYENPEIENYSEIEQTIENNENEYIEEIETQNFIQVDPPGSNP